MGLFSKSFDPATDLPDLSGKVVLITGGNAGIGYATVKHLARRGAKVYMAARNKDKAEAAIVQLNQEGLGPGHGQVTWLQLDLADPRNAKKAAAEFLTKENRLDVLIHNAALFLEKFELSQDGVQNLLVVNMISPFVLNRELLPLLKQTASQPNADVRIIAVSSNAHALVGNSRFRTIDELNNEFKDAWFPAFSRYGFTKLTNTLFANELKRRLTEEGSPITVISLHPGAVNTFSRKPELRRFSLLVEILIYPFFMNQDKGGYTSAFAAGSQEVVRQRAKFNGAYLVPFGKIATASEAARDEVRAKELWDTIERFLAEKEI
ncbi:NAD(P)-binding protein [Phlebopus sp. FC_14]|nr:NAD(P)-binding protein [Phlebopus sp. FC_14]